MRASLCLDGDVLPDLARILRSAGQDVVSAHETGALGVTDEEQLEQASAEGRALFSFNYRDFIEIGRDWFASGRAHSGIILSYRQYRRSEVRELARRVLALLDSVPVEELENSIRVLDQFRRS
ncbi:MAG: DUF5615 family PIN-like protein [Dehalococcoidia bacterium]